MRYVLYTMCLITTLIVYNTSQLLGQTNNPMDAWYRHQLRYKFVDYGARVRKICTEYDRMSILVGAKSLFFSDDGGKNWREILYILPNKKWELNPNPIVLNMELDGDKVFLLTESDMFTVNIWSGAVNRIGGDVGLNEGNFESVFRVGKGHFYIVGFMEIYEYINGEVTRLVHARGRIKSSYVTEQGELWIHKKSRMKNFISKLTKDNQFEEVISCSDISDDICGPMLVTRTGRILAVLKDRLYVSRNNNKGWEETKLKLPETQEITDFYEDYDGYVYLSTLSYDTGCGQLYVSKDSEYRCWKSLLPTCEVANIYDIEPAKKGILIGESGLRQFLTNSNKSIADVAFENIVDRNLTKYTTLGRRDYLDIRKDTSKDSYFVIFAVNSQKWHGHAVVAWAGPHKAGKQSRIQFVYGVYPHTDKKKKKLIFGAILGTEQAILLPEDIDGEFKGKTDFDPNWDIFVTEVDKKQFNDTLKKALVYQLSIGANNMDYQVGNMDCITFMQEIANHLDLEVPSRGFFSLHPVSYLTEMARKNNKPKYNILTNSDGDPIYWGTSIGNKPHGFGTASVPGGTVYSGDFHNGKAHGNGKMTLKDGTYYEGDMKNGFPNGNGKLVNKNGSYYEGDFRDGKINGQGVYHFVSGKSWHGQFKDNMPTGEGKLIFPGGHSVKARGDSNGIHWRETESREPRDHGDRDSPGVALREAREKPSIGSRSNDGSGFDFKLGVGF